MDEHKMQGGALSKANNWGFDNAMGGVASDYGQLSSLRTHEDRMTALESLFAQAWKGEAVIMSKLAIIELAARLAREVKA